MQDLSQFHAGDKEAKEYQYKMLFFTLALFSCFAAFSNELINVWWMGLITSVLVTRWLIAFHEILHLKTAEQLDPITRLMPIPFAPFSLGYREYRDIHIGHHQFTATPKDPDAFHISGGPIKAFIGALTQHEQSAWRYLRSHTLSSELSRMMLIRFAIFIALLIAAPEAFLLWWLVLRGTYIINDFVFFHVVHYRSGSLGTFALPLPALLKYPAIVIYGLDVVYATMHHDIHHNHSQIAAKHLPTVAKQINR